MSDFSTTIDEWGENTLVQGLNYDQNTDTTIGHRADNVAGQAQQDVQFIMTDAFGRKLGKIIVKKGGHGSSTGLYIDDDGVYEIWFGHDGFGCSGYVRFKRNESGVKSFTKTALPEGDIEIDQANNLLVLRNNDSAGKRDRYRIYKLDTCRTNGARDRVKIADFYIPHWGKRWQGMYISEGRLFVHRDVATKGASRAQMFDLTGKPVNFPPSKITGGKVQNWIDTSRMGDEAEGFMSKSNGDKVDIYVIKRTGPSGVKRKIQGTLIISLPKVKTPWDGTSFPGADAFSIGSRHPAVKILGERLVIHGWTGYKSGPGVPMSETDKAGVKWFQEKQGWTGTGADGIPGPQTWKRLMAAPAPKPPTDPTPEVPVGSLPAYYPPADRTKQWFPSIAGGGTLDHVDKLILHTTEGSSWFNYQSVGYGPHLTYNPKTREWRQHISLHKSATALGNYGSYKTNQANCIQVEVIGLAKDAPFWSHTTCYDIGMLVKWLSEHGLQIVAPVEFPKYPGGPNKRLTREQYVAARGVYGHSHVPGNDHGDPGAIPIDLILEFAKGKSLDEVEAPPTDLPTTKPTDNVVFGQPFNVDSPVPSGAVGYAFGVPDSGYRAKRHTGQDYKGRTGVAVVAVWGGVVRTQPFDSDGYGRYLILQADNGRDYYYCHLDAYSVENGQRVVQGQTIGKLGSTGNSTGPHLHLEDRPRGGVYNNVRKPTWPSWDGRSFIKAFVLGVSHPAVTLLGQRLVAHLGPKIYSVGPGPKFGEADKAAVKKFQEAQGWTGSDADGIPGPGTWARLMLPNLK